MMRHRAAVVVLFALGVTACGKLPDKVSYKGATLAGENAALPGGIEGKRYYDTTKPFESVPVVVWIHYTTDSRTAAQLQKALLENYDTKSLFATKNLTWEMQDTAACKIAGVGPVDHVRRFMSIQLCSEKGGHAACAEIDRDQPTFASCTGDQTDCMKDACRAQFSELRSDLEEFASQGL